MLVGPPGVGKTSLAQSIAESLGREFVRISLGGIRDEAEIRGHRRTYIGAFPGKIIQAMRKAKTLILLFCLMKSIKCQAIFMAILHLHYLKCLIRNKTKRLSIISLEIEYDLSKVMFIATANMIEGIPYPLFDRMEIIPLSGYTEDEKIEIASKIFNPKES